MTREAVKINNFFFFLPSKMRLQLIRFFLCFRVIEKNKGHFGKTWRKTLKLIMASNQKFVKKKKSVIFITDEEE
jgi:hypothetical protein